MAIRSFRRLSDATLAKYEEAERTGALTKRQASALASHRGLAGAVQLMRAEFSARMELERDERAAR